MKKKIWPIINIILPIILFIILLNNDMSEQFVNVITLSLFIGWILPFINLLLTGIILLLKINTKMSITFNILSFLLNILLIIFTSMLYNHKLLTILIEYIIIAITTLINIILITKTYIKENKVIKAQRKKEYNEIKTIKKNNNGIIK